MLRLPPAAAVGWIIVEGWWNGWSVGLFAGFDAAIDGN